MRPVFAALLLLLAAAAPEGWGDLSPWVGRYPTDGRVRLLDRPALKAGLDKVLSPADRDNLRMLTNEAPIEQIGPFMVIKQCMPHDCGNRHATIVLDTRERRLWVGLFTRTPTVTSSRWFGTSDVHDLPPDVIQGFEAQHEPK